ncbi:MAG: acyl-CoA dehydrogenase family protein [Tagaea sp.]|nr:acyl-CoA dehydrogenase family protein [Tagaea sp.]
MSAAAEFRAAADASAALLAEAKLGVSAEMGQRATHGLAWLATTVTAIGEIAAHAESLEAAGRFDAFEADLARVAMGEYLAQLAGGVPMNQGEFVRPGDLGLRAARFVAATEAFVAECARPERRARVAAALAEGREPYADESDDLAAMRGVMRGFAETELADAHRWHLEDGYIPMAIVERLAALGVFGLTVPEEFGGAGLGKEAMCAVSEELSRGFLGVGSLGTRAEIAGELILGAGTEAQKARFLPGLAAGALLPTAVFTEPDAGSDLASIRTRAIRDGEVYRVTGNKTWITHAARADLMTLLVRTDSGTKGYEGLSMLLAEKPRGTDGDPFPAPGMRGTEIRTLGYRGMKEYELAFDGFVVKAENLLGGVEGQGFRQLMRTFESARIQTAARAIGVARASLDASLAYATARRQFGKKLLDFARVADKIAIMAAEILAARLLTRHAARKKDSGARCDLEAGMAKLLAARAAWAAADNAVQIHGGNGYAVEFPVSRLLVDARILAIFEGAAEIQAEVIARRLMEGAN